MTRFVSGCVRSPSPATTGASSSCPTAATNPSSPSRYGPLGPISSANSPRRYRRHLVCSPPFSSLNSRVASRPSRESIRNVASRTFMRSPLPAGASGASVILSPPAALPDALCLLRLYTRGVSTGNCVDTIERLSRPPGRGLEPRTTRVTAKFPHQAGPPGRLENSVKGNTIARLG